MFTFRCNSCGKHHVLPAPPTQDYHTTCLRCERSIHIPGQGVTARPGMGVGRSTNATLSVAGGMASPAGRSSPGRAVGAQPGGAGSSYNPDESRVSGLMVVPRSAPVLCPGCGTHLSDSLPLEDREMSCPECGQLMLVPGSQGESSAPASARRATPGRAASEPASLDEDLDASDLEDDDSDDGEGLLSQAITRPGNKAGNRPGKAASAGGGKEAAGRKAARKKAAYELAQDDEDLDLEPEGARDEDLGEEPFADDPEPPQPGLEGELAPAGEKPWWQRWQVIAGAAVVLVLLGSVGSYFAFKKKTPVKKPPVAQRTTPGPQSAPPPPVVEEQPRPKPNPPPPLVKPKNEPVGWLAAARLGAEYSANPEAADARYKDQYLEISGLVDRIEKKPAAAPPKKGAHPVAEFEALLRGGPVSIRVSLPADFRAASRQYGGVEPEKVVTVRGMYSGRCTLQNCEVRPPTAPADARYKGRLVEVIGHVASVSTTEKEKPGQSEYPMVTLQAPTDAITDLGCYFRLTDEEEIRKLKPNAPVVIQGRCAGRTAGTALDSKPQVRLDNCELVYGSAPAGQQVARLPVGQFLREYEEDLRPVLAPLPEPGNRVDARVSVLQLGKELAADPVKAAARYQNKVLLVSGSLWEKRLTQARLVLFTDQTDINLKVRCQFTRYGISQMAEELTYKGQDYEVRGMCTLVDPKKGVTLENCSFLEDDRKGPRLTADFLPHTPGESLTYDSAAYPLVTKPRRGQAIRENPVTREAHYQRADGVTEIVKTHIGLMPHDSLFEEGNTGKWINQPKKARKLRLPGGTYLRRLSANFVEIGTPVPPAKEGEQPTILWEPLVRLGAHQGDTWKWYQPNGMVNTYTLTEFGEYEDHRAAIIHVETSYQGQAKFQVVHILAEGVGEVARKNMVPITSSESRVIGEMKLVEENNKVQKLPLLGPLFKGFTPSKEKPPASGSSDTPARDGPPSTRGKEPPAPAAPDAPARDRPSQPDPTSKDRAKPPPP